MRNGFQNGPEKDALKNEIKASLCEDQVFAVSTAHLVGNIEIDGKRLADYDNGEWLREYADIEADQINDKAAHLRGDNPESLEVDEHMERYNQKIELAENLAAVLDNLENAGVYTGQTVVDYGYATADAVVATGNQIPEVVITKAQFTNAQAVHFVATEKGNDCPLLDIGFNTGIGEDDNTNDGDQRPEQFEVVCEVEDTTTTDTSEGTTTTDTQ